MMVARYYEGVSDQIDVEFAAGRMTFNEWRRAQIDLWHVASKERAPRAPLDRWSHGSGSVPLPPATIAPAAPESKPEPTSGVRGKNVVTIKKVRREARAFNSIEPIRLVEITMRAEPWEDAS